LSLPTDINKQKELIELGLKRYSRSKRYFRPWHKRWVRYYKIWRALLDAVDEIQDADEPNSFIPYVFGMLEDIVSRVTEPLFRLTPPCKPKPKRNKHIRAAENFDTIARQFFSGSRYQIEYIGSTKEETITGNAWEKDVWAQEYEKGKRWQRVQKQSVLGTIQTLAGKVIPSAAPVTSVGFEEVEAEYPSKVGYTTEFPSVFYTHPEPRVKNVRDLHWIVEEEPSVAIEDLEKRFELDPETGEKRPMYDLTEVMKDAQAKATNEPQRARIQPIAPADTGDDFGRVALEVVSGDIEDQGQVAIEDDMDRLHILHVWEKNRVWTIANGKYLLRVKDFPFHVPRLPFRLRVYTIDPQFLYGMGAVEPIEDMQYELNDIHNLSMANWIRIINKMLAVQADKLVSVDDLEPRAGGRIRFKGNTNVHQAIAAIDHADVSPSMLTMESNSKGIMERALSIADLAPGVQGTKQTHDTATGLIEIQRNVAVRMSTIRRVHMANFQDQMWMMEKMFSQFQFQPVPFRQYGHDGQTVMVELSNSDIDTQGDGFDFVFDHDPSFGDDQVQRRQFMAFLELAYKYEEWRRNAGDPSDEKVNVPEIMRKLSLSFGWSETSQIMKPANLTMDPGREFEIMVGGGKAEVRSGEDLIGHLIQHLIQRQSPVFTQGLQTGKIPPEVADVLDEHIQETMNTIQEVLQDPQAVAQARIQDTLATGRPSGEDQQAPSPANAQV